MIVHINHISQTKKKTGKPSQLGELASLVTGSLVNFVEDGVLDASLAPSLRIHLDWIQYRTNFRDPVCVRRTTDPQGRPMALAEIAIDLRQADPAQLTLQLGRALQSMGPTSATDDGRVYLDDFGVHCAGTYQDCGVL